MYYKSPTLLNDGLIFREDFRNPTLTASNGVIITGNTWLSNGGIKFITGSLITVPRLSSSLISATPKTIIWDTDYTGFSGAYQTIIRVTVGASRIFQCGIKNDSNRLFWVSGSAGVNSSPTQITLGRKIFAITCDVTNCFFYEDGIFIGSSAGTFAKLIGSTSVTIASELNGNLFYKDPLFGIQLYNYALSAEEIKQHYQITRGNIA